MKPINRNLLRSIKDRLKDNCRTWRLRSAVLGLSLALIVPVHAIVLVVNGTPAADTITVDETTDGPDANLLPGQVIVNGVVIVEFDGTVSNNITVNGLGGNDTIKIIDGGDSDKYFPNGHDGADEVVIDDNGGDEIYVVMTHDMSDTVTIMDDWGNDKYSVMTAEYGDTVNVVDGMGDDRYDIATHSGCDTVNITDTAGNDIYGVDTGFGDGMADGDIVTIIDGVNPGKMQVYAIKTGRGNDTVTITDGADPDAYSVDLGDHNDTLTITDAAGKDRYKLDGNEHLGPPPNDEITITDAFADPDGFEIMRFEKITGAFK